MTVSIPPKPLPLMRRYISGNRGVFDGAGGDTSRAADEQGKNNDFREAVSACQTRDDASFERAYRSVNSLGQKVKSGLARIVPSQLKYIGTQNIRVYVPIKLIQLARHAPATVRERSSVLRMIGWATKYVSTAMKAINNAAAIDIITSRRRVDGTSYKFSWLRPHKKSTRAEISNIEPPKSILRRTALMFCSLCDA